MKSFCRAANLRTLISDPDAADTLIGLKPLVEKFYLNTTRQAKIEQTDLWKRYPEDYSPPAVKISSDKLVELGEQTYLALCELLSEGKSHPDPCGQILPKGYTDGKVTYAAARGKSVGNSMIFYGDSGEKVGQILLVFLHPNMPKEVLFKVQPFTKLSGSDIERNPFRKYEDIDIRTCYITPRDPPEVITLGQIQTHFASFKTRISKIDRDDCLIALSLDRVSNSTHFTEETLIGFCQK